MILLFCGIPGSGKTTIAELLAERLAPLGSVRVLSSDRLKPPVYRKLFQAVAADRKTSDFLILDATFHEKARRERVGELAGGEKVVTVYLDCPLETALERNRARRPNIPERALHIVRRRTEAPERPDIRIDTSATSPAGAAARVFDLVKDRR